MTDDYERDDGPGAYCQRCGSPGYVCEKCPPVWSDSSPAHAAGHILVTDPDIGAMTAVVLPPTSCCIDGVPVVCDMERELCLVPPAATPMEIRNAIYDHENNTGRPPRAVIFDWRKR